MIQNYITKIWTPTNTTHLINLNFSKERRDDFNRVLHFTHYEK